MIPSMSSLAKGKKNLKCLLIYLFFSLLLILLTSKRLFLSLNAEAGVLTMVLAPLSLW